MENYFNKNLRVIADRLNLTLVQLGDIMGKKKSAVSNYMKGIGEPSVYAVQQLLQHTGITFSILMDIDFTKLSSSQLDDLFNSDNNTVSEPRSEYKLKESVMVVTQDSSGNDTIPIVNIKAAANYLSGYESQEYIQELDYVSMPQWMLKNSGLYRFFTVAGDSMEPTLHDGQYILSRRLEVSEYDDIVDLNVYVIVASGLHHSGIYIKRVKNRFQDNGFIRCRSDNRLHSPFNLYLDEIVEIWKVEWYFTSYFPNLNETLFDKIESLQHRIEDIEINLKKK